MRIEFVGLPAAGKTHACITTHADLQRRGIPARLDCAEDWRPRRRRLVRDYFRVAAGRHQRVTVTSSVVWLVRSTADEARMPRPAAWSACAYLAAVDAHVRALEPAPAWLHDQGTVQALWSLSMRSGVHVADVAARYRSRIAWPDLVVEVQSPLPAIMDRLAERRVVPGSLQNGDGEGLLGLLVDGAARTATLRRAASTLSVPWLVLAAHDQPGERVAQHVQKVLRR